mgnify:CR=1 FL=1
MRIESSTLQMQSQHVATRMHSQTSRLEMWVGDRPASTPLARQAPPLQISTAARLAQAAVEQHHDADGIIWPVAIAPFQVIVVIANVQESAQVGVGRNAVQRMLGQGDGGRLAGGQGLALLGQGQIMQRAHSITLGTRNRPPSWAGALAMLASRLLGSVTASARRRRVTSSMADSGV